MMELTPGQLLIQSRERCHLSQADVAQQLHLSLQTVKDLEQDDYLHIGVRTFVRGYLRAYARLVQLPESQVLNAFDALSIPAFEEQIVPAMAAIQEVEIREPRNFSPVAAWGGYVFAVLCLILLIIGAVRMIPQHASQPKVLSTSQQAVPQAAQPTAQPKQLSTLQPISKPLPSTQSFYLVKQPQDHT